MVWSVALKQCSSENSSRTGSGQPFSGYLVDPCGWLCAFDVEILFDSSIILRWISLPARLRYLTISPCVAYVMMSEAKGFSWQWSLSS